MLHATASAGAPLLPRRRLPKGPLRSSPLAMEAPLTAAKTAAASRYQPTPRWRPLPRAASLPPPPSCSSLRSQRQRLPHRRKNRRPPGGSLRVRQLFRCRCITTGMKLSGARRHQAQAKAHSWELGPRVLTRTAQLHQLLLCHHLMFLQIMRLQWATAKDLWTEHRTHPGLHSHWRLPLCLAPRQRWEHRRGPVLKGREIPYVEALRNQQTAKEATRCSRRKRRHHRGTIC